MTAAGALVWAAVALWAALGAYTSATDLREGIIPGRWVWRAGFAVAALLGAAAVLSGDPLRLAGASPPPPAWDWRSRSALHPSGLLATAAGVGLALEVIYRIAPEGIGFGDVRLIILNSLLVAWWGPPRALFAGALAAWPQALASVRLRPARTVMPASVRRCRSGGPFRCA